jgi:hypothetical protein
VRIFQALLSLYCLCIVSVSLQTTVQSQTHLENGTLYLCHSSCDLLNAGTLTDYLTTVYRWVEKHPFDVVTILLGNSNFVDVQNYVKPIRDSGLHRYVYTPPRIPMGLDDWPRLSDMILTQKRVVIFLDYKADQDAVPYILDQFSQLWETPFSPTDISFPCYTQRPPGLTRQQSLQRMYMANHNLNTHLKLGSLDILVPNLVALNITNGVNGTGSLGLHSSECTSKLSLSLCLSVSLFLSPSPQTE